MPENRYAFLLGRRGQQNTDDIYAQLQAPAQRQAIQTTLNEAVAKGAPTQVPILDQATAMPTGEFYLQYNAAPDYTTARRAADVAGYKATINPAELARGIQGNISPANIKNAYINPVAEGMYDTTPTFDWAGRQVAGYGAIRPTPTKTDAMMYDLKYGRDAQSKTYQDAIDKAITNAEYQQSVNQSAYETARIPPIRPIGSFQRPSGEWYIPPEEFGARFGEGQAALQNQLNQMQAAQAYELAVGNARVTAENQGAPSFLRNQGLFDLSPIGASYTAPFRL